MTFVVIDNEIYLCDRQIGENWTVEMPKTTYERTSQYKKAVLLPSHGTVCCSILVESFHKPAKLIGYSCAGDGEKITVEEVCTKLYSCLNSPPSYLCMSIGTTNWLETNQLAELTKKLASTGTKIFAACANNGRIAFPAAYPWVTGVRYEPGPAGLYQEEASPIGCNIVAGDFTTSVLEKLAKENPFFESRTNSMAAPYALGTMVSEGLVLEDLPKWPKPQPIEEIRELPMPAVALQGPIKQMKDLLALLQKESYQAALLTDRQAADWISMVLHVGEKDFFTWIPPLAEAGILLLDMEGSLASMREYTDYSLDLSQLDIQSAYEAILRFFGTEDHENEEA